MRAAESKADDKPTLDPRFVEKMVRTFTDPDEHGVHLLFNEWWPYAPDVAIERYVEALRAVPGAETFLADACLAEPVSPTALAEMPPSSLGRAYYTFLAENGLEKNLAVNYKMLHDAMVGSGQLDRMPAEMRYAIIRGFQVHDILHVVTGHTPSGLHELALQAFCLAQLPFPYFGMWVATTTSRMTFLEPAGIKPVMDSIAQGWQFGRSVRNLQFERWESMFEEPLVDVRARYGVAPEGMRAA